MLTNDRLRAVADCPCGYRASLLTSGQWHYVKCIGPGVHEGPRALAKDIAIGRWNTRARFEPSAIVGGEEGGHG